MFTKTVILLATVAVALASPTCVCGKEKKPVCGTDAHTYDNECLLMCAGLTNSYIKVQHKGPCAQQHPLPIPDPSCICPFLYSPVCGTDGNTYSNECDLNCMKAARGNLEIKAQGACENIEHVQVVEGNQLPICQCMRNYKPVCGTDGHSYNNECMLRCNQGMNKDLQIAREGPCETVKVVENMNTDTVQVVEDVNTNEKKLGTCVCGKAFKQVCGTDGNSYSNSCELKCAAVNNPSLRINNEGPCDDKVKVVN